MNLYRRILSRNGGTVDIIERFTCESTGVRIPGSDRAK